MRSLSSESDSVLSIAVTSGPYFVGVFAGDVALQEADEAAVRSIYIIRHAAEARRHGQSRSSKHGVVK
jgi:hypothetical protein